MIRFTLNNGTPLLNIALILSFGTRSVLTVLPLSSGYEIRKDPLLVPNGMAIRVATIFLAWSFIYLLPYNLSSFFEFGLLGPVKVAYWNLLGLLQDPYNILLQGTKVSIGLLFALYICFLFVNNNAEKFLLIFAAVFYIVGVLLKSYADSPLGHHVDFNTRNGPFFSTL